MSDGGDFSRGCDTCAKACVDCKTNMVSLEKKNFKMAIALTSALTLLGEQGVKAVAGMVESIWKVTEDAPKEAKETASAGDDAYRFGGSRASTPTFSGWRPSWQDPVGTASDTTLTFADAGWGGPRAADLVSGTLTATPSSYISQSAWQLPVQADAWVSPLSAPATAELLASLPTRSPDFRTPSPFGGYRAHLEEGVGSVSTIPGPGSLCVFAVGGLFGSRSRA